MPDRTEAFLLVEVLRGLCVDCLLSGEMQPLCRPYTVSLAPVVQLNNFIALVGNNSLF